MKAVLGGGVLGSAAASPVAVAVLSVAQKLAERPRRVSEVLIRPLPGRAPLVAAELRRLAAGRLDVRAGRLRTGPARARRSSPTASSTSLFEAISVMIGFLLALNAMLLTVPERRRFIAELRMQGYDPRPDRAAAGLPGAGAGGRGLADRRRRWETRSRGRCSSARRTSSAPPSRSEPKRRCTLGTVLLAIGCGVLATALASLSPLLDLRSGVPPTPSFARAPRRRQRGRLTAHDRKARARGRGADRGDDRDRPAGAGRDDRRGSRARAGVPVSDPRRVLHRRPRAAAAGRTRPLQRPDRRARGAARDHHALGGARRDRRDRGLRGRGDRRRPRRSPARHRTGHHAVLLHRPDLGHVRARRVQHELVRARRAGARDRACPGRRLGARLSGRAARRRASGACGCAAGPPATPSRSNRASCAKATSRAPHG